MDTQKKWGTNNVLNVCIFLRAIPNKAGRIDKMCPSEQAKKILSVYINQFGKKFYLTELLQKQLRQRQKGPYD